ncbi:hypothetical protein [Flavobacterium algicola]|uniref:hypothetical protein n=1 Tax=Flavobacterium algicola TaxID=556529 RepID=UPI001EFE2943|nr:hypothetical protein [Flavobacterium algicola]MCG9793688.1 hypothetical protein [Flavobacterium algicola]
MNYDFNKVGWPAWYPTSKLEEWEKAKALWKPNVFRSPTAPMENPNINNLPAKHKKEAD